MNIRTNANASQFIVIKCVNTDVSNTVWDGYAGQTVFITSL